MAYRKDKPLVCSDPAVVCRQRPASLPSYHPEFTVANKNIVNIDSVDFFAEVVVRSRHESDRPSPTVHPTRTVPKPRPLTPRNSGASPTAGDGEPSTTQATPISLG